MFTGIVEDVGLIRQVRSDGAGARLEASSPLGRKLKLGESIAVNGVCLTVASRWDEGFSASVMPETLRKTTLGSLRSGDKVNLERALSLGERLGGHLVLGHVDGVGTLVSNVPEGAARVLTIRCPERLLRYIVEKGSIAVDGVSLTVSGLDGKGFRVSLVTYTMEHTTLGRYGPGQQLNLECDVIGKYVERLLAPRRSSSLDEKIELFDPEGIAAIASRGWGLGDRS